MIERRKTLVAVLGALALSVAGKAAMRPVSLPVAGFEPAHACVTSLSERADRLRPFDGPDVADLDLSPIRPVPISDRSAGSAGPAQSVSTLSEGQNSFSLCLFALFGLGLYKTIPLGRKLSVGCAWIPQWYHDGGPAQIGHSFAVSPDCLCSALVCFVQPDSTVEDPIPSYHSRSVISCWRTSQFTPALLASRGPPSLS